MQRRLAAFGRRRERRQGFAGERVVRLPSVGNGA
jgi:hypothetical protein